MHEMSYYGFGVGRRIRGNRRREAKAFSSKNGNRGPSTSPETTMVKISMFSVIVALSPVVPNRGRRFSYDRS